MYFNKLIKHKGYNYSCSCFNNLFFKSCVEIDKCFYLLDKKMRSYSQALEIISLSGSKDYTDQNKPKIAEIIKRNNQEASNNKSNFNSNNALQNDQNAVVNEKSQHQSRLNDRPGISNIFCSKDKLINNLIIGFCKFDTTLENFELDTESGISLISEETWKKLAPRRDKLKVQQSTLFNLSCEQLKVVGSTDCVFDGVGIKKHD